MVEEKDLVLFELSDAQIKESIDVAKKIADSIIDRGDLHNRDFLEKFLDILMGEIAEKLVISWFERNNKFVESAVDKNSDKPDLGHDIILKASGGRVIKASIKSSLSVFKKPKDIIEGFTLATTAREIRDINIQVYFWLDIYGEPRRNLPNTDNLAIVAWCGKNDITAFAEYSTESRESPKIRLKDLRTMDSLLPYLI